MEKIYKFFRDIFSEAWVDEPRIDFWFSFLLIFGLVPLSFGVALKVFWILPLAITFYNSNIIISSFFLLTLFAPLCVYGGGTAIIKFIKRVFRNFNKSKPLSRVLIIYNISLSLFIAYIIMYYSTPWEVDKVVTEIVDIIIADFRMIELNSFLVGITAALVVFSLTRPITKRDNEEAITSSLKAIGYNETPDLIGATKDIGKLLRDPAPIGSYNEKFNNKPIRE